MKVKKFIITQEALFSMFEPGNHAFRIEDRTFPKDARILGGLFKDREIVLFIESAEFNDNDDLPPVIAHPITLKTYER